MTAPLPWFIKSSEINITGVVHDRNGQIIAFFWDYQNAQAVLDAFDEIATLKAEIESLEVTNEELSNKVADLEEELNENSN